MPILRSFLPPVVAAGAVAFAAIAPSALPATVQHAAFPCGDRGALLRSLDQDFDEKPTSIALTREGSMLEVLKSQQGVTWSIVITTRDGVSCLVSEGERWFDKGGAPSQPVLEMRMAPPI